MDIFSVISRHVDWLSQRQAVAAANIANLDAPGFKAKTIQPFDSVLGKDFVQMTATNPAHFGVSEAETRVYGVDESPIKTESYSGNTVNLENEMMTVGQTTRQFNVDTGLAKLFHRLVLTSVKG